MRYYQRLATMPVFTLKDAKDVLGSEKQSSKVMNSLVKEGSVHRIRKDLYTCVNFATGDDYASRFQIASKINCDSFISFHSAFEFYGFYNQMFYDVQVCSPKRFSSFSYNDYQYKWYQAKTLTQVVTVQGVRVVTIERAIADSICMLGKVMDAEELVECLDLVHRVDEKKILEMLSIYNQERLYRKAGYVLSHYEDDLHISRSFFDICKQRGVLANKGYLVESDKTNLTFNSTWGLYAYGNLKELSSKGGGLYV